MEFLGSIGGAVNSMFIPFVFSATEACMLELAAEEGRDTSGLNVWLADGTLYRGGILSLPYAAGEVHELSYAQSADTLYLAHSNHPPARLMRYGMDDWRYEVIDWMPDIAAPAAPAISWEGNPGEWNWQRGACHIQICRYRRGQNQRRRDRSRRRKPKSRIAFRSARTVITLC